MGAPLEGDVHAEGVPPLARIVEAVRDRLGTPAALHAVLLPEIEPAEIHSAGASHRSGPDDARQSVFQRVRSLGEAQREGRLGSRVMRERLQLSVPAAVLLRHVHHLLMGRPFMNRHTVAYTGALLMLALGCKDLNLGPKDQVSDASFWKSPDQFKLAANDFYWRLLGAQNYTELNSDIATGSGNSVMSSLSNGSFLPQANDTVWDN